MQAYEAVIQGSLPAAVKLLTDLDIATVSIDEISPKLQLLKDVHAPHVEQPLGFVQHRGQIALVTELLFGEHQQDLSQALSNETLRSWDSR